jgi:hypothetical protein
MTHFNPHDKEAGIRHPEWLSIGADVGTLVNQIAGRYDLVGLAGPNAGSGAPACFKPAIAEVEVNTDVAFGIGITPEMIGDIKLRDTQYDFPKAIGAIAHEAFHARFSAWDLTAAQIALNEDEFKALVLLEESRIEARGAIAEPRYRVFLRSSALEIALEDVENFEGDSVEQLAQLVGLVHGRVIADILDIDEVQEILDLVESGLGRDTVEKLSSILRKFQAHDNNSDLTAVYPLAIEWVKIVRELAEERGEIPTAEQMEMMRKIMQKLAEASDGIGVANYSDLEDQRESEDWKEEVNQRADKAKEVREHDDVAKEVFGKGTGPSHAKTRSTLIGRRKPTGEERSAAVIVARMLEKAKYRERDITEVASILPPGRLRPKALVQQAALRDKGIHKQVEAFRKNKRTHTEDPTLTVGVMVDISGSMNAAMEPMATTAWVMSEAVKRVQGKCAMVYYGSDVFPTLKAGQHLDEVAIYSAPDGTEKFDKAFKAINGSLDLLNGTGARLLVVVSDGEYTNDERRSARSWMSRCEQAGVAVLWLPFDNGRSARDLLNGSSVGVMAGTMDPAKTAGEIGSMAAKLLTKVGKRNA